MDLSLAIRLDSNDPRYDAGLYDKCAKVASDYVKNGLATLNYFAPSFDAAFDLANALQPLLEGTTISQFEKLDRSSSKNFSHPCGATQIEVLATAISQILFGRDTNRSVEPRNDADETKAEAVNQLLAWNDQQNDAYATGFDWVKDCLIVNRGVFYDHWYPLYQTTKEKVTYEIPFLSEIDPDTRKKTKPPKDYKPQTAERWRTVQKEIGGYSKLDVISPYDFICDPSIPIKRMQEGRYCGHRVILTWQELHRRSQLDPSDYNYVLPAVVKKLKNARARKGITGIGAASTLNNNTRSNFERQRRGVLTPDIGMVDKVNKEDGGTVECWLMTIRMRPKTYGIYQDDTDELIEFFIANETDLLSVNVKNNEHGQYPYAVGEARPGAHQQFSPSWANLMQPTQAMIDVLKGAHAEQVERNGSLFLGDPTKCDITAVLTDKSRVRQLVTRTEEAQGIPNDQILSQINMQDPSKDMPGEMQFWEGVMEKTSGAHSQVQGQTEDPSQTATQWDGTQEMAMGRLSTIARNLSSRALMPQTRRIVMDLQQFMPDVMKVRIMGDNPEVFDPEKPVVRFMDIRRDPAAPEDLAGFDDPVTIQQKLSQGIPPNPPPPELVATDIQMEFDVIPTDGAMPGTDAKEVAALARIMEAAANPAFQQHFDNTIPGNIDGKAVLVRAISKSGAHVRNLLITRETAQKNVREKMMAQGLGMPIPQGGPQQQTQPSTLPLGPQPPVDPLGQASAAVLPQNPSAQPPQPQGGNITPLTTA